MATVFTSAGEAIVADLIDGTSAVHYDSTNSYIEWGTGVTAAAKGDTDIETASAEARSQATASQSAADTNQWVATITATGSRAITEAGLFNNSTAGTLLIRSVFTVINVATNDAIQFTFTIQWA